MVDQPVHCSVCGRAFAADQVQVQPEGDALCHTCALTAAAAWSRWQQDSSRVRASRRARIQQWARRRPVAAALSGGAALVVVVAALIWIASGRGGAPDAAPAGDGYEQAAAVLATTITRGNELQQTGRFHEALSEFKSARALAQQFVGTRPELSARIATLDQSIAALERVTAQDQPRPRSVFDEGVGARPATMPGAGDE
jgi:hypothetical protein